MLKQAIKNSFETAQTLDWDNILYLVQSGENINTRDESGRTLLMLASKNDEVSVVRRLALAGADVDLRDEAGLRASDYTKNERIRATLCYFEKPATSISSASAAGCLPKLSNFLS